MEAEEEEGAEAVVKVHLRVFNSFRFFSSFFLISISVLYPNGYICIQMDTYLK